MTLSVSVVVLLCNSVNQVRNSLSRHSVVHEALKAMVSRRRRRRRTHETIETNIQKLLDNVTFT